MFGTVLVLTLTRLRFPGSSHVKLPIGDRISSLQSSKKYLSSPAGSVSYMTTESLLLLVTTFKSRCACARASSAIKTGDNSSA